MRLQTWVRRLIISSAAVLFVPWAAIRAAAAAEGQMTWAVHVSMAPAWFDPGEHPGGIIQMMIFYALHDALVKPMPGNPTAPSLAKSWTVSPDGLVYEFALRRGVIFHNGDAMTAEDVRFSFDRYAGAAAKLFKEKVAAVEIVEARCASASGCREPWPDFMAFFATPATGAGWIVPKAYVEKVGDDGFKKDPVGAGPYKFISFNPGVEMVLEGARALLAQGTAR